MLLVRTLNSSDDRVTYCRTRGGVIALCGGNWVLEPTTTLENVAGGAVP